MDNNKMARVAKNFDTFAKVGDKIAVAAGIVCAVTAILTLIFGNKMFEAGTVTLDLDFVKFHLSSDTYVNMQFMQFYVCATTLGGSVLCFLLSYICKVLGVILAPMKMGRPFEKGTPKHLRKIGYAVLIGGLLSEVIGIIARVLLINAYSIDELFTSTAISKIEFVLTMNFDFVLIACVIFFLSYIFAYGQVLQQDSDETL